MVLLRHFHRAPLRVMRLQRRKSMMRIRFSMIRLKTALSQETEETKQMLRIYQHYVTGHVSKEELLFANQQLADVLRATGLGIFAILPFAPVTIPLIVKLGRKLGIEVMPSAFAPKPNTVEAKSSVAKANVVTSSAVINHDLTKQSNTVATTQTATSHAQHDAETPASTAVKTSLAMTATPNAPEVTATHSDTDAQTAKPASSTI